MPFALMSFLLFYFALLPKHSFIRHLTILNPFPLVLLGEIQTFECMVVYCVTSAFTQQQTYERSSFDYNYQNSFRFSIIILILKPRWGLNKKKSQINMRKIKSEGFC